MFNFFPTWCVQSCFACVCYGLLEKHLSTSDHMQNYMTFDLLKQSLCLYVRMSMHRKSGEEEEGQGVWFVEEMKTLRILVPIFSLKRYHK